jgi:hypothetical protein
VFVIGRCPHYCCHLCLLAGIFLREPSHLLFPAQGDWVVDWRKSVHHGCFAVTQGSWECELLKNQRQVLRNSIRKVGGSWPTTNCDLRLCTLMVVTACLSEGVVMWVQVQVGIGVGAFAGHRMAHWAIMVYQQLIQNGCCLNSGWQYQPSDGQVGPCHVRAQRICYSTWRGSRAREDADDYLYLHMLTQINQKVSVMIYVYSNNY